MSSGFPLRRQNEVHVATIAVPGNGDTHPYNIDNPWAGAYTKTFMRDTHNMDLHNSGDKPYTLASSLSALKSSGDNVITHAAFAHGLTIFVLVASFGHISGAHFNPAVTCSVALAGKMHPLLVIPYWIAQLLGSIAGSLLVRAVTTQMEYDSILGGATIWQLSNDERWYQGVIVEVVLTAILVQTVLTCAVDTKENSLAPLAIGLTVTLDIFGAGSITGASMNPARSFGPCAVAAFFSAVNDKSVIWTMHYIYWAGPILGGAISAFLYRTVFGRGYNRLF